MNLRQLSYFLQIAELQSFTRAADVLHVAQPSPSRQTQQLEHELGVLLLTHCEDGRDFYVKDLADDCAAGGRYEFFFCAPPLPITRGCGSPINPMAIK